MLKRMAVLAVALVGLAAAPAAAQQYPPAENLVTVSDNTPCPGGPVTITAQTFTPGSTVAVTLDGASLGAPTADGEGIVTLDATIPDTTPLGTHTISASGPGSDNAPMDLTASVDVVSCDQAPAPTTAPAAGGGRDLPTTGSDTTMNLVRVGLGLAAVGGVLLAVATKRRRRASASAATA